MKFNVRAAASVMLAAVAALACASAGADNYPSKFVTVIVPQPPGGANDTVARIVAQKLSQELGQQFVIDNRGGAGGNIGVAAAAKAPKDGYTLLMALGSALTVNPALYSKTGFDPIKDFQPITTIATAPYVLVANPSFPANNVKELIALAKSKPGQIQYASAGNGTPNHLLAEMFQDSAGIELQHIPYKGAAAAVTDVISGQVPIAFQSMPSSMSYVKSGKLKILGVATEKRTALAPDIPAISETVPGFYTVSWYGLLAPAGTPKDIVEKLRAATVKALSDKEVREKLAAQGAEPFITTPEQFAALIKDEMPKWAKIVKESGAKVD